MKNQPSGYVEAGRMRHGPYRSKPNSGCNGAFVVKSPEGGWLKIIACDGTDDESEGFEHVSVSAPHRTPIWEEMAWVKDQFWEPSEVCFQLHPSADQYVNCHPFCLHIWRHRISSPPLPTTALVGPKR